MNRRVALASALLSVLLVVQCSDNSSKSLSPLISNGRTLSGSLFVAVGGTGDGTADHPFGSIQQGIDAAAKRTPVPAVYVATGDYMETVRLCAGIHIYGGCDPHDLWRSREGLETNLHGVATSSLATTVWAVNLEKAAVLTRINIAGCDAIAPGQSSFGLYCMNSSEVVIEDATLTSGIAMDGADGLPGVAGLYGRGANTNWTGSTVALGGGGGQGATTTRDSEMGHQGFCEGGVQTGGVGGQSSNLLGSSGGSGGAGESGQSGTDGLPATASLHAALLNGLVDLKSRGGADGTDGSTGCGGGGGGGSGCFQLRHFDSLKTYDGVGGEAGGAGGEGGTKATGGQGGGNAVVAFAYRSTVRFVDCHVVTGKGGNGGAGALGGEGGAGGLGWSAWCTLVCGGSGGKGGDGGRGGHGGSGAGGWSVAGIAIQSAMTFENSTFDYAQAGKGGTGPTGIAPSGKVRKVETVAL